MATRKSKKRPADFDDKDVQRAFGLLTKEREKKEAA
jgi:hypothetical protein